MSIGSKGAENKIHVKPYEGISPRRYDDLFLYVERKDKDESPVKWKEGVADFSARVNAKDLESENKDLEPEKK